MNSSLFTTPLALGVALLLAHQLLITLGFSGALGWIIPVALLPAYLLYQRKPVELLLIGALTALAMPQAHTEERLDIASDVFLSMSMSLLLLPSVMAAMGLEYATKIKRTT